MTARRVCSIPPERLVSISRFRRVAASSTILSAGASICKALMCGSAARWVSCVYCSSAPAAQIARFKSSQPKPCRSCVENCSQSRRCAACCSKYQGASSRRQLLSMGSDVFSAIRHSAGCRRCNSLASSVAESTSTTQKWPLPISSVARPKPSSWACTAASRFSRRSSSRASSVTVPGVIIRMTLRSTGPFEVAGSPICSQMATLSPSLIRRARYPSTAW